MPFSDTELHRATQLNQCVKPRVSRRVLVGPRVDLGMLDAAIPTVQLLGQHKQRRPLEE